MRRLSVRILGSGGAAQKHKAAFDELPDMFQVTDTDFPDIVDVCTVNSRHFEQAAAAIATSHVIIEKPVCASLYEFDELCGLAAATDHQICPIFQYRFSNHSPLSTWIRSNWRRNAGYYAGWRGKWDIALGGCLTSHGIHLFDLLIKAYGLPHTVSCNANAGRQVERIATIFLRWSDRAGRVTVKVGPDIETEGFSLGNSHIGFIGQFARLYHALIDDRPMPVTMLEARQSLELLTACYHSTFIEQSITLPIVKDHPCYRGWQWQFAQPSPQSRSSRKKFG